MAKRILMIVMLLILGATSLWASPAIGDSASAKAASPETLSVGNQKVTADTAKTLAQAESVYPVTPERRELLNKYSNFKLGWSVFYDILNWIILLAIVLTGVSF